MTNPVTVTMDGNGVATAVTFNTAWQQMKLPAGTGSGRSNGRKGGYNKRVAQGRRGHKENGSGM